MHLEWDLNEKETKAMEDLCAGKGLNPQQIMRQSLSLLQAIHLGLYKVSENRDNPFYHDLAKYQELTGKPVPPAYFSFEGTLICTEEDKGQAKIGELSVPEGERDTDSDTLFVRIQSWDEKKEHPDMKKIEGKKIKVTVEEV
jgi:hypothetical protein